MSNAMAVLILGTFLCRPLQNKNRNSGLPRERKPQERIFKICVSIFTLSSIFSFEIVLTKGNIEANRLRVL